MVERFKFLDIKDVSRVLGKHEQTIRRWIKEEKIIAYRIEGKFHIKEEDLNKFIEASKIT